MPRTVVLLPILVFLTLPCGLAGQERAAPGVRVEWPADAFRDAGARDLVLHALALRDSAAAGLDSYEATATERMHVGFQVTRRLPLRSRTLYHREQVARVYWQRSGDNRVRWLGRREGRPVMGDDWSERAPFGLDFDIAEELDLDDIGIDMLFDPHGDRMDVFEGEFVQPVSARGLRLYRFASGDTMHIRLPSPDRTITLVEVTVLPREKDWETVEGSLWFDRDSGVLVRAGFRPSGVWDMAVREPGDLDDVPGFLHPAVGSVTSIVIEYGLYEQRWWLPRRVLADGVLDWGRGLVRMPLIIEWTMTGHAVNEAPGPAVVPGPELATVGWNRSNGSGRLERTQYLAERGVDLSRSPDLPPPVADVTLLAFTREELAPLVRRIEQVAGPPPRGPAPALLPSLLQSLRYDRVRGPSAGLEWAGDAGRFRLSAQGRLAAAVPEPFAEAAAARGAFTATLYHRLADASDWNVADGLGNTMATLQFGHDGGDYFRATGFSLARSTAGERGHVNVEAFVEDQRPIARQANLSLATLGGGSLRPNLAADAVMLAGTRVSLAGQLGSNPRRAVLNGRVWAEAATGDAEYTRVAASARLTTTPFDGLALATELAAGTASRGAPVQRGFLLGGAGTLRGVEENAVAGRTFWLARAEAGTPLPGARALVFIDVGWAGARDGFARSQPSAGTGLGASFMDGLFRFDIARGIVRSDAWRVYFYLDALL
jgi:hypothetical protein